MFKRLAGTVALGLLTGLVGASPATAGDHRSVDDYAALGDSYSSGVGRSSGISTSTAANGG